MSHTSSSWLLQWGQVHFVLWSSEQFIRVAGSLFLSRAPYLSIPALLVVLSNVKVICTLSLDLFQNTGKSSVLTISACFKMFSAKNLVAFLWILSNFVSSFFLVFFSLSSTVKTQVFMTWVVCWWIRLVLILASVPCPLEHLRGAVLARALPLFQLCSAQLWTVQEIHLIRDKLLSAVWRIVKGFWFLFLCVGREYILYS